MAKKLRRELRQKAQGMETRIAVGMKQWVNKLPLKDRFKIALRIVRGRF